VDSWPAFGIPLWFTLARHRLLGRLAEASGDDDAAADSYRAARRLVEGDPEGAAWCPAEVAAVHAAAEALTRGREPDVPAARAPSAPERPALAVVPAAGGEWPAEHAALTPREREVVRLVAQGLTSREVAAALYVTPKAISYHLGNVFAKLGVTSRRQLWGRRF
jgi:DNA-binding CsgD family transcriptional regulator